MSKLRDMTEEETRSFEANGRKYVVEKSLSVDRYRALQKIQLELGFSVGFSGIFDALKKVYEYLQTPKVADAAVLAHNTLNSIHGLESRELPIMTACALFMNREDEDRRVVNEELMEEKINDWKEAGIPFDFFYLAAKSLLIGYNDLLKAAEALSSRVEGPQSPSTSTKSDQE